MITGFGEAGEWNGQHFRSPTVLDFGDYLLTAFEGWPDDDAAAGIGLLIGVERWLLPLESSIQLPASASETTDIVLGNYGAGNLVINDINIVGGGYMISAPNTPLILESAEELRIPVKGTQPGSQGLVLIESDSQIQNPLVIDLNTQ